MVQDTPNMDKKKSVFDDDLTPQLLASKLGSEVNEHFRLSLINAYRKGDTDALYDAMHSFYAKVWAEENEE